MDPFSESFFKTILDAVVNHQWYLVASLGVVLATASARRWAPWPALKTDVGGTALAFVLAFAGALATAFAAGARPNAALFGTAASVAVTAIGGYATLKKFFWPLITHLLGLKTPVEQATADGQAAVDAAPPGGIVSILKKP